MFKGKHSAISRLTRLILFFVLVDYLVYDEMYRSLVFLVLSFTLEGYLHQQPLYYYFTTGQLMIRTLWGYRYIPYSAISSFQIRKTVIIIYTQSKQFVMKPILFAEFVKTLQEKTQQVITDSPS